MISIFVKLLVAVAPAIVLAILMISRDTRRSEPIKWLWAAVGLGVMVGPAVLLLALLGLPDFSSDTYIGAFLSAFITAAMPEEGLKFLALLILARWCKHFDEFFDGIVYAVCIGMGFAGLENILYVFGDEDWIYISISRALLSVPMHYFFAIIMGTFFSLGWFDKRNQKVYFTAALLLPIVVHGLYDFLCFSLGVSESFSFFFLLVFIFGFRWARKYVKSLTASMFKLDEYRNAH